MESQLQQKDQELQQLRTELALSRQRETEKDKYIASLDEKTKTTAAITLKLASDTLIRRHIKIRNEATPFDPTYEAYFENRMSAKMASNKEGRRKVGTLWKRQKGCCSICGERITSVTSWSVHCLEGRLEGGSGNLSNLTLLHPNCQERGFKDGFKYLFPAGVNKTPA